MAIDRNIERIESESRSDVWTVVAIAIIAALAYAAFEAYNSETTIRNDNTYTTGTTTNR